MISIDFAATSVQATLATLKEAGVAPNVVQADLHHLPLREGVADCVYSFGVLHHIPDIETVLNEIRRIIKTDGEVIRMLYNRHSILYAFSILFLHKDDTKSEQELLSMYSERVFGCPYTKAYLKEEAVNLFSSYFVNVEAAVRYNVIDLPGQRKFKLNIPDTYELSWHIILRCKSKRSTVKT